MPKKSKTTNKKSKKPSAKAKVIVAKKARPKGSKKKAIPSTKKLKPSAPTLARAGFAAAAASVVTEAVVEAGCLPYPLAEELVLLGTPSASGEPHLYEPKSRIQ
jgi:hypothetical protein